MRVAPRLLATVLLSLSATAAWPACGDVSTDGAEVAAARAQVATDCDCAGAASHGAFVACAAGVASGRVTGGLLRPECAREVRRCAMRASCGRPGAVTCCRTRNGVTRCRVKRSAAACTPAPGGSACVGAFASCCDACGANGCVPTTTTSSTTSSTSTTIPPISCTGGSGAPVCDGTCDTGLECASYFDVTGFALACACFPAGVPRCSSTPYPQCGGACPGATACSPFSAYDPPSGTFVNFCACIDPSIPCVSDPDGSCVSVGYCGPGFACQYTPIAPHENCPCCGCAVAF